MRQDLFPFISTHNIFPGYQLAFQLKLQIQSLVSLKGTVTVIRKFAQIGSKLNDENEQNCRIVI